MSDIDDELLALAGGDVSSDEEEPMDMSRDESRSPSPARASSRDKDTPARGAAAKKTTAKKARRRGGRSDGESDEEGEASSPPASPSSQMSAPMEESDSDSDAPQNRAQGADDMLNQYPVEGLFKSHEEKARIMSMREIEREQILAERREENERIRQNRMLRQLKVNQEKENKKRKASGAGLEDAQRKSSRARTKAGESSEKMDTLRRAREERTSRKEQRERENDRRKQRSPSYRRSRSVDEHDSDAEWRRESRQKSRTPEPREAPPAELRDVERVRLGRSRFAEVCFYPGFEKAITGCFVRINIGPDPTTRQEVYRMAIIKGFTQGRPYAIPDHSGHHMVVDLYVKAAHGKAQREWPFISCSDHRFTEAEWNRYKQVCLSEGVPVPSKPELVDKIDDINGLLQRTWTEQEVTEKLRRQNALLAKFSGADRDHLTRQLEMALARGDQEAAKRLQERLDNLETPRLAFRTSLHPEKKKLESRGPTQQEKLAMLNAENRRRNAEAVRKAQLMERARTREIEMRLNRGEQVEDDHSRRMRTGMKLVHDGNESREPTAKNGAASASANGSGASTPATATTTPSGNGTPSQKPVLPHIAKLQEQQRKQAKPGVPVIHKPLTDDDIIGALDLDIDVEI
ncbi:f8e7016a-95ce-4a7e-8395-85e6c269b462 [Thermothielavioides terrestris]|uniref:F8e7016a-95ce-4a7e-8395-85e6c269b462 n=1 Tax=Thermothielavioides terrestris TaxID=2587410 RepID=A0A446BW76_9PEZI|nr:f8e7016a-95ce-4a7e-8395-85e6c269b462 [Thermothielavioides terrestris]